MKDALNLLRELRDVLLSWWPFIIAYKTQISSVLSTGLVVPAASYFFWWVSIRRPRRVLLHDLASDAKIGIGRLDELVVESSAHNLRRYCAAVESTAERLAMNRSMFASGNLEVSTVATSFFVSAKELQGLLEEIDGEFWSKKVVINYHEGARELTRYENCLIPYVRLANFLRKYGVARDLLPQLKAKFKSDDGKRVFRARISASLPLNSSMDYSGAL